MLEVNSRNRLQRDLDSRDESKKIVVDEMVEEGTSVSISNACESAGIARRACDYQRVKHMDKHFAGICSAP